jgi:hypothetical protein
MFEYVTDKMTVTSVAGVCTHTQRYFYLVKDIDRSQELQATTLVGTRKIFSVRNTGVSGYVEVRESSCFCRSCVQGEGGNVDCDEADLVRQFERRNLIGKLQTVQADHPNEFWPDQAKKPQTKKQGRPAKRAATRGRATTARTARTTKPTSTQACSTVTPLVTNMTVLQSEARYSEMLNEMAKLTTWGQLLEYVRERIADLPPLPETFFPDRMSLDREDVLSDLSIPLETFIYSERTEYWFCVDTSKDGNCLPHVLSRYVYGHKGRASEMRVRMCFEGVYNYRDYGDSGNLVLGGEGDDNLARIYAEQSGQDTVPLDLNQPDHVLMVFQLEIMDCTKKGMYSGLWALHVAANVLARPIISWFPAVEDEALAYIRDFLQRRIEPFERSYRDRKTAIIMWTKTKPDSVQYDHFIPVCR